MPGMTGYGLRAFGFQDLKRKTSRKTANRKSKFRNTELLRSTDTMSITVDWSFFFKSAPKGFKVGLSFLILIRAFPSKLESILPFERGTFSSNMPHFCKQQQRRSNHPSKLSCTNPHLGLERIHNQTSQANMYLALISNKKDPILARLHHNFVKESSVCNLS